MTASAITAYACWGAFGALILWCAIKTPADAPASVPAAQPEPVSFDERELDEIELLEDLYALPAARERQS